MSFDGFMKRNIYWANDLLHGGEIWNMREEIKKCADYSVGYSIQQEKLQKLLSWAYKESEFYKPFAGRALSELPVVNKLILTENHAKNCVPKERIPWQKGDIYVQTTSGSTGVKFAVPQDTRKRHRRIAELKYYNEKAGFPSHEKLGQCRIWTKWQMKSPFQSFWENIIPIQLGKLDDDMVNSLLETIEKKKLFCLRAYASWYDFIVDFLTRNPEAISKLKTLRLCISISEALNPATREKMMDIAGIHIVESYADEEGGTLAHQIRGGGAFYLNHSGYIFEFLKPDKDEPASFGELARIVFTDLHNYAFPMIRYDTGDMGIFAAGDEKSGGWPYMEKLYGRKLDIVFDAFGKPIHAMNFGRTIRNFPTVRQWQFIQKDKLDYVLKLKLDNDTELTAIKNIVSEILGSEASIQIEIIDEIPVLTSGKRKPVVCEWKDAPFLHSS